MRFKRALPLVLVFVLAGCFRQAEDTFDTVGSQNTGAITITEQVPPTATDSVTIIDPNATDVPDVDAASLDEASATPRTIVAVPTNTVSVEPTATVVIPSSTPQVIPTATEPTFITPEVVVQETQITSTPSATPVVSTLQPTPTGIGAEAISDDTCAYQVQNGDNLFRIALNNDVTLTALLAGNNLTEASVIQPGQVLIIPGCDSDDSAEPETVEAPIEPTAIVLEDCDYEIQSGDTLFSIAIQNDVTLAALLAENDLVEASIIQPGQIVTIPNCEDGDTTDTESASTDASDTTVDEGVSVTATPEQTIHTVVASDTLISIARQYNVTVNDILQANTIPNPNRLTQGQQLIIPDSE